MASGTLAGGQSQCSLSWGPWLWQNPFLNLFVLQTIEETFGSSRPREDWLLAKIPKAQPKPDGVCVGAKVTPLFPPSTTLVSEPLCRSWVYLAPKM